MPEETTKQAAQHVTQTAAPLWALAGGASVVGGVAQAAVTLALGMTYSTARFVGFVLLSMVISGGVTILLAEVAHVSALVAAVIGALTGTVPSLIVVRIALQKLLEKYDVQLAPGALAVLEQVPPEHDSAPPLPTEGGDPHDRDA